MTTNFRYSNGRILLFSKAPVPSQVKTRLAPALGEDGAAQLQAELFRHSLQQVADAGLAPLQLWCAPDSRNPIFSWAHRTYDLSLHSQATGDLGARMHQALAEALRTAEFAVVIGTDCPALNADYLEAALAALQSGSPAVLGPAEDGGYVLLGLRQTMPQLFEAMPWGSAQVLAETRSRLGQERLELPTLWDVDRLEDVSRLFMERQGLNLSAEFKRLLQLLLAP